MVWPPVLVSLVPYANVVVSEQLRKGPERQNLANVYFFALLASRQMGVQPHLPFLLSSAPSSNYRRQYTVRAKAVALAKVAGTSGASVRSLVTLKCILTVRQARVSLSVFCRQVCDAHARGDWLGEWL